MLIDIEGIDGSGKGTQSKLLCDRLAREGIAAQVISFPRYDSTFFGKMVGEFLNGRFGTLDAVDPFLAALLFAGDRLESKAMLAEALAKNQVVVLDRYVASNVAHQAAKRDGAERTALIERILHVEFEINALPQPDLVWLLDLPVSVAQKLIAKKSPRSYTEKSADIQEADAVYLEKVREVYHALAQNNPRWRIVPSCDGNRLRTVSEIAEKIWEVVRDSSGVLTAESRSRRES